MQVGKPAVITTKGVRNLLEQGNRLEDVVSAWENYGNVTGANDLGHHRLAAILSCQHYGDAAVERFAALAGESVTTDRSGGRGSGLSYETDLANAYLQHMTKDQTMQAILRFARGEDGGGATVVARTSALREDLPVVGRGEVVETWSDTATKIARQWRRLDGQFTAADVADAVDVTARQVRRVLAELAEAGYLSVTAAGPGKAKKYEPQSTPGAGEVDLPDRPEAGWAPDSGGPSSSNQSYTWNVRVSGTKRERAGPVEVMRRVLREHPRPHRSYQATDCGWRTPLVVRALLCEARCVNLPCLRHREAVPAGLDDCDLLTTKLESPATKPR